MLAYNHDHVLNLVQEVLGSSQFVVVGLKPSSTVIPAGKLQLVQLENVLRLYMAQSSTSTSLYQHWLQAKEEGLTEFNHAGHDLTVAALRPNGLLPYLMDTPSTKDEHGVNRDGKIVVADELYTMDSSRFWRMDDRGELMSHHGKPISFSKEFARDMVKEKNQQFTEEQANEIAVRYIQGLQHLTGEAFLPDLRPRDQRIIGSCNLILDELLVH